MLKWSHMTQTHLADRHISQPSESSGLKLCGTKQKLDNWVPEFSANEKKVVECTVTAKVHTHAQYTIRSQRCLSCVLCCSFPLCRLTHSFCCSRRWPRFTTGKKERMKERKGSPWQQLLQFVGTNMCDDIIQHHWSEVPADAYPLYLSVKISSFEKKEKNKSSGKCDISPV